MMSPLRALRAVAWLLLPAVPAVSLQAEDLGLWAMPELTAAEFSARANEICDETLAAAGIAWPISRPALASGLNAEFIAGMLAQAIEEITGRKGLVTAGPMSITIRLLGPPPWQSRITPGIKPAQVGELVEAHKAALLRLDQFKEHLAEFQARYLAPDVACDYRVDIHPAVYAQWAHALKSVGTFVAHGGPSGSPGQIRVKLLAILNQMPAALRARFGVLTLQEATTPDGTGSFVVTSAPVGSMDAAWHYQRFVTIRVYPVREAASTHPQVVPAVVNWDVSVFFTLKRRRGAEDFDPRFTVSGRSGPAEQELLDYILTRMP